MPKVSSWKRLHGLTGVAVALGALLALASARPAGAQLACYTQSPYLMDNCGNPDASQQDYEFRYANGGYFAYADGTNYLVFCKANDLTIYNVGNPRRPDLAERAPTSPGTGTRSTPAATRTGRTRATSGTWPRRGTSGTRSSRWASTGGTSSASLGATEGSSGRVPPCAGSGLQRVRERRGVQRRDLDDVRRRPEAGPGEHRERRHHDQDLPDRHRHRAHGRARARPT